MSNDPTFVVTLRLDERSFSRLDNLRQRYFPPNRNFLSAHLTLFHTLTDRHCARLAQHLVTLSWQPLDLHFAHPKLIGNGVAVPVIQADLERRHQHMLNLFADLQLTGQDQQPLRPHVTVQNRVTSAVAKATLAEIEIDFEEWEGQGLGVDVWRYLGGPWSPHAYLPFSSGTSSDA